MGNFDVFKLHKFLNKAVIELGYENPTPVQAKSFPIIKSGADIVGISQTGTGKTLAYLIPILQELPFSKQYTPRVLILVPTRELVIQVVDTINSLTKYMGIRVYGVYGGVNINTQKHDVKEGLDVVVATPGRLYDLAICLSIPLKNIKRLVIDEVDIMLDLGFRYQLKNIFDLLPESHQNIMFSATMTDEVNELINTFFKSPKRLNIALSGEPLKNINQTCYLVNNFHTKINLLQHLLLDREEFSKVVVFLSSKKMADKVYSFMSSTNTGIIHSNKSQNYRIETLNNFDKGDYQVLIATDLISRGLDFFKVTHVINFDTPSFPENYIHRIGRSGRANQKGNSILFYSPKEQNSKLQIEQLMNLKITKIDFPESVEKSEQLITEEKETSNYKQSKNRTSKRTAGDSFHIKTNKNSKKNLGGKYKREIKAKYKKSLTRGDKKQNMKKKNR